MEAWVRYTVASIGWLKKCLPHFFFFLSFRLHWAAPARRHVHVAVEDVHVVALVQQSRVVAAERPRPQKEKW